MPLKVSILPALIDNYIYFLQDEESSKTAVIDPADAKLVLNYLKTNNFELDFILNTHHHWDHTDGNLELIEKTGAKVIGAKKDHHRIPGISIQLEEGDTFNLGASPMQVLEVPGHTLGAIAYYFDSDRTLFTGDTLFSLGCGRIFEGTPPQMFSSLAKLKMLPKETRIYCGHEYTEKNRQFSLTLDPDNQELLAFKKSAPTTLGLELRLNPFLTADLNQFIKIRSLRDQY